MLFPSTDQVQNEELGRNSLSFSKPPRFGGKRFHEDQISRGSFQYSGNEFKIMEHSFGKNIGKKILPNTVTCKVIILRCYNTNPIPNGLYTYFTKEEFHIYHY